MSHIVSSARLDIHQWDRHHVERWRSLASIQSACWMTWSAKFCVHVLLEAPGFGPEVEHAYKL